jgi:hypothetical protein
MTMNLEPSTFTKKENRIKIAPQNPIPSEHLNDFNLEYYIILNTEHNHRSDFALAFWYNDSAALWVEATVLQIKRQNTATSLTLETVTRGRINAISMNRMYPDLPVNPLSQGLSQDQLDALHTQRQVVNFMKRTYLANFNLKFNAAWQELGEAEQTKLLKALDKFAEDKFPDIANSLLVDTPLGESNMAYCVYIGQYEELVNFVTMLKAEAKIQKYLDNGFGNLTICNHTIREVLESPQTMVRKS